MVQHSPAHIYAENVDKFLGFRTGHHVTGPLTEARKTEITKAVNQVGYFHATAGGILVLLVSPDSAALTGKDAIKTMFDRLFERVIRPMGSARPLEELIIVPIISSSHAKVGQLKRMRETLNDIQAVSPKLLIRLDTTGGFCFDQLARPSFAARKSLCASSGQPARHLHSDVMTDEDKKAYLHLVRDFSGFPAIEEQNTFCVWNGYRVGQLIWIENLSPNTAIATNFRRVIPSSLPKETEEQEVKEESDE